MAGCPACISRRARVPTVPNRELSEILLVTRFLLPSRRCAGGLLRAVGLLSALALHACSLDADGIGDGVGDAEREPDDDGRSAGRGVDAGVVRDARAVDLADGTPSAPSDAGDLRTAIETDAMAPGGCSLSGAFAMRVAFDVDWDGTGLLGVPLIAPGTGTLTVDALATVRDTGSGQVDAMIKPCGTDIPDFAAAPRLLAPNPEQYGVYVPVSAWEQPGMPSWPVTWRLTCRERRCAIETSVLDAWMGGLPRDPTAPASRMTIDPVDVDADRQPGLTLLTRGPDDVGASGAPYAHPPVSLLGERASKVMLAIRMRAHFGGQLDTCDAMSGESNDGEVAAFAVGCATGTPQETTCDRRTVDSLDRNMPTWKVRAARYFTTRIAEPSCSAVRAALGLRISP